MKRDQLKELSLTDEQIDKIMGWNGADIEATKSSFGDVDAIKQENESLKTQISDRDKDLKGLQKQLKDNDDVTGQLTDLQAKYDADTQKLTEQLNTTKLNGALTNALTAAKVRNPKAAKALLDMDQVKLDDKGELTGLDTQLEAIKKSDGYLFDEGTNTEYNPGGGNGSDDTNDVQSLVDAFKN